MFTGIIEELGSVRAIDRREGGARLEIAASTVLADARVGDSIAVNGCCLTVVDRLVAYVSPKVLGPGGLPAFRAPDVDTVADAEDWRLLSATPIDDDVRLEYEPEGG